MARLGTLPFPRLAAARPNWRLLGREQFASILLPVVTVALLAIIHQFGLFRDSDGRLFDRYAVLGSATAPQVVVIERNARFAAMGETGRASLDAALAQQGIARIGYLDQQPPEGAPTGALRIHARLADCVPLGDRWIFTGAPVSTGPRTEVAAGNLAPSEYGIQRGQYLGLPAAGRIVPSFEARLAGIPPSEGEFLVRMPRTQSIPVIPASQIVNGELASTDLEGLVAIVAGRQSLAPTLATSREPDRLAMSPALFRAHAVQTLATGQHVQRAGVWDSWIVLLAAGLALTVAYRRSDPKRMIFQVSLIASVVILLGGLLALELAGRLLPLTALLLAPWIIAVQRMLIRERRQDNRLEQVAARAVQNSVRRSALREGARLPQFVEPAARIAGVSKSLLMELSGTGELALVSGIDASLDDIAMDRAEFGRELRKLRGRQGGFDAASLVPGWDCEARLTWIGGADRNLFWLYAVPPGGRSGKRGQLVRAAASSFRELFRWRADLNARERQEERYLPIDEKVASAIELVSRESDQVRRGFDTIDTAIIIFHLIGSPLHANRAMEELYQEAGLALHETPLVDALVALTTLDVVRIEAMLQELVVRGGEMRLPMRELGPVERILRVAAPDSMARGTDRVIVLEAVDITDLHAAADLRQSVGLFIDLQLRNDLEAILLASDLAANPRLERDRVGPIVARIGEAARRATGRLDEVAELVRGENDDLVEACYPVDARSLVLQTLEKTVGLAEDLDVTIDVQLPAMSGFTIAEPRALADMLEAMIRVVVADTPQGDTVVVKLEEQDTQTQIQVSGGFGIGFGRLVYLLTKGEDQSVGEYRQINRGIARTSKWGGSVSYWGRDARGFGFNVKLRRIG
ncbi:hypothetical protein P8Q88_07795 [Qipengyuania sp. XHP0207]|uniref:hypothetical protein n=1 Tax=Qipengyuania sp. XHP0207 TaxID=3038078 RepID=UPI00241C64F5|nr:hypothetical protein [Qipengyuania sp. XHP0207]MDG5748081.1 hypothetical protein [Qipengyuania sp. XHP0207]